MSRVMDGLLYKLTGTASFTKGKPVLSVDQYAPVLRAALLSLEEIPNPNMFDPADPDAVAAYIVASSVVWERVNARRLELEQVQPEPRLAAVHTEAVKLLRAWITWMNCGNGSVAANLQGDFVNYQKLQKEAESWLPVVQSVAQKLTQALDRVRVEQWALYGRLGLEGTAFGTPAEQVGMARMAAMMHERRQQPAAAKSDTPAEETEAMSALPILYPECMNYLSALHAAADEPASTESPRVGPTANDKHKRAVTMETPAPVVERDAH